MDFSKIPSPSYVLDETRLRANLELMQRVKTESGAHIIVAFKGFSMWSAFPMVRQYLNGATASSLYEARLCFEEMKTLAHTYAAVHFPNDFAQIMRYSSHLSFNSLNEFYRYYPPVKRYKKHKISCGIRINPEFSVVETELYNPGKAGTRLGTDIKNLGDSLPEGIEGIHVHCLCESSAKDTEGLLKAVETKLGHFLPKIKWLNIGGGHLMTRKGYDVQHLIHALKTFKNRYPHLDLILEPGSAVGWDTGILVSKVLDIVDNHGVKTIMPDVSFTAHMPDTLEMPYRPNIRGASDPIAGKPTYRIGGTSCLSGDFMDFYSFDKDVRVGDTLIFEDMIHYTMVKTTMFNGVQHPSIGIWRENETFDLIRKFSYSDYKKRLS
jgi:carboxynorspermidine decarboxylase